MSEDPAHPSISVGPEEISLILEGIQGLPDERKKTVVFDRLMMKLGKVNTYWMKVSKAREQNKQTLADKLMGKADV
jgi:hypothetical protein